MSWMYTAITSSGLALWANAQGALGRVPSPPSPVPFTNVFKLIMIYDLM